jgi:hypothetical protein
MKNGVFWDFMPCGSCKNHLVFIRSVRRLLVIASVVPSSPILVTLTKESLSSLEPHGVTFQKTPFFVTNQCNIFYVSSHI